MVSTQRLWFWIRIALVIIVATVSAFLFTLVSTTDHPHDIPVHEALYRAITLYVVGAQGMPSPASEGTIPYYLLWTCYFLAPCLTATFAADAIRRLRSALRTPRRVASRGRNHVIMCGYGKHGRLLLEQIMARKGYGTAVVIDHDPVLNAFQAVKGAAQEVPVLRDNLAADVKGVLEAASISRAHMLVAATGNDVLNVAICIAAREMVGERGPHLLALMSNESLADGIRDALRKKDIRTRNTYQAAARSLLREKLSNAPPGQPLALVIIGCGRFGTALAHAAQRISANGRQISHLGILDLAGKKKLSILRAESACRVPPVGVDGDAEDPEKLMEILSLCPPVSHKIVALCTDNDAVNLRLSFKIEAQVRSEAVLLTRMFDSPPASVLDVLRANNVECFELNGLIAREVDGYLERLGAPAESDVEV